MGYASQPRSRGVYAQSRLSMQRWAAGGKREPQPRQAAADPGARLQLAVQVQRLIRQDVLGAHARVPGPAATTLSSTASEEHPHGLLHGLPKQGESAAKAK
jgi:hypothetical protein